MTDEQLRKWFDDNRLDESLCSHFSALECLDWCDVASELLRVEGVMFGNPAASDSPFDFLISAACRQAHRAAISAVAAALGVNGEDLTWAIEEWVDSKWPGSKGPTPPPPAIGFEELRQRVADCHQERIALGQERQ